jgi:hypothetical protein
MSGYDWPVICAVIFETAFPPTGLIGEREVEQKL